MFTYESYTGGPGGGKAPLPGEVLGYPPPRVRCQPLQASPPARRHTESPPGRLQSHGDTHTPTHSLLSVRTGRNGIHRCFKQLGQVWVLPPALPAVRDPGGASVTCSSDTTTLTL